MMHLNQEELVEHYYNDDEDHRGAMRHIEGCTECAAAFVELESDLADVGSMEAPSRGAEYGAQVWRNLAGSLVAYPAKGSGRLARRLWMGLGYAAACGVLIAGAFFAGRVWEQRQPHPAATVKTPAPVVKQHVVVVVLGDHLDRSERLLVELKHADVADDQSLSPLRDEARSLLSANRTFRRDAEKAGDPALETALGHLDRLLNELAQKPGGMNAASIVKLQKEMNEDGLLFEVRVLRARIPDRRTSGQGRSHGGTV